MTREEEIRKRYEKELADMRREQEACTHVWDEPKYDPEIKPIVECSVGMSPGQKCAVLRRTQDFSSQQKQAHLDS